MLIAHALNSLSSLYSPISRRKILSRQRKKCNFKFTKFLSKNFDTPFLYTISMTFLLPSSRLSVTLYFPRVFSLSLVSLALNIRSFTLSLLAFEHFEVWAHTEPGSMWTPYNVVFWSPRNPLSNNHQPSLKTLWCWETHTTMHAPYTIPNSSGGGDLLCCKLNFFCTQCISHDGFIVFI